MKPEAIIFDLYNTLLRVALPRTDTDEEWTKLCSEMLGTPPPLSHLEFSLACREAVAKQQQEVRAQGIAFPEIDWPQIVATALSAFSSLSSHQQREFVRRQIALAHTVSLVPEAVAVLKKMSDRGVLLGIASNAQAYSLNEFADELAPHGLGLNLFAKELCFWSFEHGFSKPDPYVFRILTARLGAQGIRPDGVLMVGDRLDNDIEPARSQGWMTWHITPSLEQSWKELHHALLAGSVSR